MKIKSLMLQEEKQKQISAKTYQSTMSHELRTPILSVIFLLERIIQMLQGQNGTSKGVNPA